MQYVYVGSWKQPKNGLLNYTIPAVNQSENLLISLIDVLQKNNLGVDQNFKKEITYTKSNLLPHHKLYLDSGGYSVIVGDVKGSEVNSFIDYYNSYQRQYKDIYDFIFSLDIPVFLNEPIYNTKENLYNFNYRSLFSSKENMLKCPIIRDKFLFVWQFKILDQYKIWSKLYDELKMSEVVKNRALGGMVGLRGITQINFSPFIGPLFRCLFDYIENGDFSYPFKVHNLGIYIQHDRFFLCFLEKMFQRWLSKLFSVKETIITYDSVNYMRTAQLRARELQINTFRSGNRIETFKHIETPTEILKQVYNTEQLYNNILVEIQNCKNDKKLNNVDAFTPLNVYSNVQLDIFFMHLINTLNFTDVAQDYKGWVKPLEQIKYAHENIFSSQRIKSLEQNFEHFYKFKQWFLKAYYLKQYKTKEERLEQLDILLYDFIKQINFPAHFEDVYKYRVKNLNEDDDI